MYEDFVPERICKLRQDKNVSARDMSLSLGLNPNYINHIEIKRINPSLQTLYYICEYLGVSPKEFFDEENENPGLLSELTGELKKLDAPSLEHILGIAKKLNSKGK